MSDPEEAEVAAWFGAAADRTIETACARVFLTGERAFKVKRHVELGYLDYSTLELRRWALERELAFNHAAASDIYRAVRRITRTSDGALELDGRGALVEFVLEMRRFDEHAVLSAQPWVVDGGLADALGRTVADFHAAAPIRPQGGGGRALKFTIDSNAHLLRELSSDLGAERVERLTALTDAAFVACEPLLNARRDAGFARHCHGDLHLGNILLEDGAPILFDCIEFNDILSEVDVQYDLAFLLMDLQFRRRSDAAVRVLSAYLDAALRTFGSQVLDGLAALPLMLSVRAAVRAHVSAHSADLDGASAYLDAALAHLAPVEARLAAVGGLSGTGKTTFARLIAPGLGPSPGAVVLRTDEIRKRLAGAGPTERLPGSTYTAEFYTRVYDTLFAEAGRLLRAGRAVVLDATFLQPELRARAEALAAECGAPFDGVFLQAPVEVLAARIEGRTGDASDADVEILGRQIEQLNDLATGPGPAWTRVDASGPAEASAEAWAALPARQATA